jgi:hypothetical protein
VSETELQNLDEETVADAPGQRDFETLTLAELTGELLRRPGATLSALIELARHTAPRDPEIDQATRQLDELIHKKTQPVSIDDTPTLSPIPQSAEMPGLAESPTIPGEKTVVMREVYPYGVAAFQWLLRIAGFGIVLAAQVYMLFAPRSEAAGLDVGAPYLLLGFGVWMVGEIVGLHPALRLNPSSPEQMKSLASQIDWITLLWRASVAALGTVCALLAWRFTAGNQFTLEGVAGWLGGVILWVWALAPLDWSLLGAVRGALSAVRTWRPRLSSEALWTLSALILIMGAGVFFRFSEFDSVPPEMTSDHVEKLLDANGVVNGRYNVFFVNNHGRDPLQFYLLALMHSGFGLPLDFNLLKLLTAIEGLLTIPLMWVLGRVVIGRSNPQLGNWVGLSAAALVAVAGWHVMLSRLGLRIVLTPLVTTILLIFLARALRYNRRWDWIDVGLTLGFGVYTYQAVRMLPVVVVVGVGLTLLFGLFQWGVNRLAVSRDMLVNLAAAGIIAFVAFVPLFRFSIEYPEDFWRRTSGRLFGDAIMQDTNEAGELIFRQATLEERLSAFNQNLPALMTNLRNAFLMYNWKGDVAWINNAPNYPTLDPVAGALFLVGLAAWLMRMLRRRDSVDWLMLPMIFIMLLPSALAIAYPIENPSATRASGTLPVVFLIAGYALALMGHSLGRLLGGQFLARGAATVAAVGVIGGSYYYGSLVYFNNYYLAYRTSALPYSDAGRVMRSFADNNGYGNVFVIAYRYWWDHRALGIEGGRIDFPNGIPSLERAPQFIADAARRTGEYRFDPDREMLFFYAPQDTAASAWLSAMFPFGVENLLDTYHPEDSYVIYRVPPIGAEGLAFFLAQNGIQMPPG